MALGPAWLDPMQILNGMGGWALVVAVAIIFAECGLLLGFFLPGDSLLFTAGLLMKTGTIDTPKYMPLEQIPEQFRAIRQELQKMPEK